ncbi:STAS domain-containing protein [Chitinilyticum piscinae]|uniref:STAS domain-containing protein n=1 Tax=Chitinilyticum piscinae TaxID=2866724 RepID=A0A8J7FKG5_9NEIS|nr:STAS domain-containing protein [Chitinilyticum piscinae]MBE9609647.1 STAS domain-containing protein [Chitinilyticum piscinae]
MLTLDNEQTIFQIGQTHQLLHEALEAGGVLEIGLQQVEECDSSLIQLLWWLKQEAQARQRPLQFVNPSDCVLEIASVLGMHGLFASEGVSHEH